jgi:hypothetical protein
MAKYARTARCTVTAFDELECVIPYDPGLIEAWKDAIPFRHRSYEPTSKAWRFLSEYRDVAAALLLERFPDADIPGRTRSRVGAAPRPTGSDHYATLHLLPTAPRAVIDAAFRALSKACHPDRGGSDAAMRRLIEAHDALNRRLSA